MSVGQRSNRRQHHTWTRVGVGLLVAVFWGGSALFGQERPPKVTSLRLYIFDHGYVRLTPEFVRRTYGPPFDPDKFSHTPDIASPFHVIVHPRGTLVWETGNPDSAMTKPAERNPASGIWYEPPSKSVLDQLAMIGYKPEDIMYYAFSHYHANGAGNSNLFAGSTWLARKAERDFIFGDKPPADTSHVSALKNARTVAIETDGYDVFGDGTVVLMKAHGHTPGHQVLMLRLAKTGPIMLAGTLYHWVEERPPLSWFPSLTEVDPEQSRESRARIEEYVKKTRTQLWLGHDLDAYAKRKKAPEYYE